MLEEGCCWGWGTVVSGLVQIHASVFSIVVNCWSGSLVVEVWRVVLGESAANPMKTCVLLILIVLRSVSMKT